MSALPTLGALLCFCVLVRSPDDQRRGFRLVDLALRQLVRDLSRIELQERIRFLPGIWHVCVCLAG